MTTPLGFNARIGQLFTLGAIGALSGALMTPAAAAPGPRTAAPAPDVTIQVSGTDVGTYPAFDADRSRYGITTGEETDGEVIVSVSGVDAQNVLVQGQPAAGPTAVSGLDSGDEVSVILGNSGESYSFVYLPTDFPALETNVNEPGASPLPVAITLTRFVQGNTAETIMARDGVPLWLNETTGSSVDLRSQPNGSYSVARPETQAGRKGQKIVELNAAMEPIDEYRTDGLVNTDNHDAILLENGNTLLMAYEDRPNGRTDAVIQELDASGSMIFEWDSSEYFDESVNQASNPMFGTGIDYSHINSLDIAADGDIIASFRHFSAAFKIARTAHDGFQPGEVVWKLGGRDSSFEFVDDPFAGGPCAQHAVSELANGNILVYDNGSWTLGTPMCIDPADPDGDPITRTSTRVTEYELDEDAGTATLVWDWSPERFASFAGSAERLPTGQTLVGWAALRAAIASEVDSSGSLVWELRTVEDSVKAQPGPGDPTFRLGTYSAQAVDYTDAINPVAAFEDDSQIVSTGSQPVPYCSDRGGSNLVSCEVTGGAEADEDSAVFTVTATDGAGNTEVSSSRFSVAPALRGDAQVNAGDGYVGVGAYGINPAQRVRVDFANREQVRSMKVRVVNTGTEATKFRVAGPGSSKYWRVVYRAGGSSVTSQVVGTRYKTAAVEPGGKAVVVVKVTRKKAAGDGRKRVLRFNVSPTGSKFSDQVSAKVRAR